eukprot:6180628-Pleurochrysis_carterae.AAC.2
MRPGEILALPVLIESAFSSASASSIFANSGAASDGLWPYMQPGAMQGRGTSSLAAAYAKHCIKARLRMQPHHPELEMCLEWQSADISKTTYVLVFSLRGRLANVIGPKTFERSFATAHW